MVALANLYTILDVSTQQLAVGLAILPSLVALAWYVSHPAHRRHLSPKVGSDAHRDEREGYSGVVEGLDRCCMGGEHLSS